MVNAYLRLSTELFATPKPSPASLTQSHRSQAPELSKRYKYRVLTIYITFAIIHRAHSAQTPTSSRPSPEFRAQTQNNPNPFCSLQVCVRTQLLATPVSSCRYSQFAVHPPGIPPKKRTASETANSQPDPKARPIRARCFNTRTICRTICCTVPLFKVLS